MLGVEHLATFDSPIGPTIVQGFRTGAAAWYLTQSRSVSGPDTRGV